MRLRRQATAGNLEAAFDLGMVLRDHDPVEAARWWRLAAQGGDIVAAFNLILLLKDRDPEEAARWGRQAASKGDAEAALELGGLLETKDPAEAIRWWCQAADAGDPRVSSTVAFNLGQIYLGRKELSEAERWWRQAVKAEGTAARVAAAFHLGILTADRDPVEAEQWWRVAAEAGHAAAALNLGSLLRARPEDSVRWSELAALGARRAGDAALEAKAEFTLGQALAGTEEYRYGLPLDDVDASGLGADRDRPGSIYSPRRRAPCHPQRPPPARL
jgi:TPR repeat protein